MTSMAATAQANTSRGTSNYNEALRLTGEARARALQTPLATNALLVALKLVVWILSGSVSVLSEALHSGADLVVTTFQLISVRLAARPADADHAYGHGKYENIGAALEAIFILTTAGVVVAHAIHQIRLPAPITHLNIGIGVMMLSAIVNFFVSRRLGQTAKAEQSPALQAEAAQLRADVWTAIGVALGLIAIRLTSATLIDAIISLMIAGLIVKSAYDVSVRAFVDLTDGRLPAAEEAHIQQIIERHHDIFASYHKLRTRRSGGGEFIDFHLQLPGNMPLQQAHALSDIIVLDIKQTFPRAHVLIHLEPDI